MLALVWPASVQEMVNAGAGGSSLLIGVQSTVPTMSMSDILDDQVRRAGQKGSGVELRGIPIKGCRPGRVLPPYHACTGVQELCV